MGTNRLFREISYDLSDRLTATVGARMFESKFSSPGGGWSGYFYDSKSADLLQVMATNRRRIYKFNLTYDVNDNLLTFFNYAEGFRPGGGNTAGATNPNVPEPYQTRCVRLF